MDMDMEMEMGLGMGLRSKNRLKRNKDNDDENAELSNNNKKQHTLALPWVGLVSGSRESLGDPNALFLNVNHLLPYHVDSFHMTRFPQFCGHSIRASYHGWLLLQLDIDYEDIHNQSPPLSLSLFNPVSSTLINLPHLCTPHSFSLYAAFDVYNTFTPPRFILNPSTSNLEWDCIVFLFSASQAYFCRPSHSSWTVASSILVQDRGEYVDILSVVASPEGLLYALAYTQTTKLLIAVVIQVHFPSLIVSSLVQPSLTASRSLGTPLRSYGDDWHLLHSCNHLFAANIWSVSCDSDVSKIVLWKLDLTNPKGWVRVFSLGDQVLFLGFNCSFSCPLSTISVEPKEGEEEVGGLVYFIREHDVYLLSLKDYCKTYLVCYWNNRLSGLPDGVEGQPFWFMNRCLECHGDRVNLEVAHLLASSAISHDVIAELQATKVKEMQGIVHKADSPFLRLPSHLIAFIAKNLHFFDYLSFRSICKTIHSAAPLGFGYCKAAAFPFLITLIPDKCGIRFSSCVVDPCRNELLLFGSLVAHMADHILSSNYGWLLLHNHTRKCLRFYNPFTRATVTLPPSPSFRVSTGFSVPPTSPRCLVVRMVPAVENIIVFEFCNLREQMWKSIRLDLTGLQLDFATCDAPVYHDGAFYYLDAKKLLGVLKPTGGEPAFTWDVYGKPKTLIHPDCRCYLISCGEQLLSVCMDHLMDWIQVFRLDCSNMDWVEVNNLGDDYSLFLGKPSSVAVMTRDDCEGMGDRIYLPRLRGQANVVYYSLKLKKYYSHSSGRDDVENFCGMREPLHSLWIESRGSILESM